MSLEVEVGINHKQESISQPKKINERQFRAFIALLENDTMLLVNRKHRRFNAKIIKKKWKIKMQKHSFSQLFLMFTFSLFLSYIVLNEIIKSFKSSDSHNGLVNLQLILVMQFLDCVMLNFCCQFYIGAIRKRFTVLEKNWTLLQHKTYTVLQFLTRLFSKLTRSHTQLAQAAIFKFDWQKMVENHLHNNFDKFVAICKVF